MQNSPVVIAPAGVAWWRAASLEGLLPGLVHGFTGALPELAGAPFAQSLRAHLAERFGAASLPLQLLDQHHSAEIVEAPAGLPAPVASAATSLDRCARADGAIVTVGPGAVAVQSADCVPVLAVHAARGAVAALHAGWRGASAGILPRLLARWSGSGRDVRGVRLAFGPSIRACCYEVRADCTAAFAPDDLAGAVTERRGRTFLELTHVLQNQAETLGVAPEAIEILPHCTCCEGNGSDRWPFASFRRDGRPGQPFPFRNASYIGLLAP